MFDSDLFGETSSICTGPEPSGPIGTFSLGH
jgi:hypothetical protein